MSQTREVDVLVIGGGPAGSTVSSVLKKYNPSLRVTLVEQSAYPRYHIGESLILELNRILQDMGAMDAISRAGFLKKGGSTFVWGKDREPWFLLFPEADFMRQGGEPGLYGHTWHVVRAQYDSILLDTARGHGVEILQPAKVTRILEEPSGRITGALVEQDGATTEIRARYVVDTGGRTGPISRMRGKRIWDPVLRNVATYGYWKGVDLEEKYSMTWDLSLINVIAIPIGWIWFIPVRRGIVSTGVVTSHERFTNRTESSLEEFYHAHLATSPEVARWIEDAELIQFENAPKRIMTEMDFNYAHDHLAGDGWALAGDAGGFVDPLFSIGVFLAQTAGQMLAYALGTALSAPDEAEAARVLSAYEHHMQTHMASFRQMAYVFYGFNLTKEEWWEKTRSVIHDQALSSDLADRDAFMSALFGFGINLPLFHEATAMLGQMLGMTVRDALLGRGSSDADYRNFERTPELPKSATPKLIRECRRIPSAVPVEGTGRMVPMTRLEFDPIATTGTSATASFPRHIYVPDEMAGLLDKLDGKTTIAELTRTVQPSRSLSHFPRVDPTRFVAHMVKALAGLGALSGV